MRENERDSGGVRRLNGPIVFAGFLPKTPSASYTHTHTHKHARKDAHSHKHTHTKTKNLKNSHQLLSFQQQPRQVTSATQKQITEQVKTPHINATASRKGLKEPVRTRSTENLPVALTKECLLERHKIVHHPLFVIY